MKKINSILLVDDDYVANFLHQTLISNMNITSEISTSSNGQEALERVKDKCLQQHGIDESCMDLIFLDLNMPVMNGFEFLEEFEKFKSEINQKPPVVVLLTSSSDANDIDKAKQYNVADYINKPLTEDKIYHLLNDNLI